MRTALTGVLAIGLELLPLVAASARAQTAPADFDLLGVAGDLGPGGVSASVHIRVTGQGIYLLTLADSLNAPALDSLAFTLSSAQLDQLWQTISSNGFFSLATSSGNSNILDRSVISLSIRGNGTSRTVTNSNVASPAFDAILAAVNALTPGGRDLVEDVSDLPTFTPQDGCGNTAPYASASKAEMLTAARAGMESLARPPTPPEHADVIDAPHAGTAVAYRLTLQEALARHIVTFTAKGGFFGDAVSVTVDNTAGQTSNDLEADFFLDTFGPDAGSAGSANTDSVMASIYRSWGGWTTTGGALLKIGVTIHNFDGNSPPAEMGFHQILLGDASSSPPVPYSATSSLATINSGAVAGTWNTQNREYAHEAGHLLGLPDRYTAYLKQGDGSWLPSGGGSALSPDALATLLEPAYPQFTHADIVSMLGQPGHDRVTVPNPGHEDDIMGKSNALPLHSDIDAIASQAGLLVDVPLKTILLNKDPHSQNLVTTRDIPMFIPKGQTRTINGVWTACMDPSKHSPTTGVGYDVGPPLTDWAGFPAATALGTLLEYVQQQPRFCVDTAQLSIWDVISGSISFAADSAYILGAGLTPPLPPGFPHLLDPDTASAASAFVVPRELVHPTVTSSTAGIVPPDQPITFSATVASPTNAGVSISPTWTALVPPGSSAAPSPASGLTTTLVPDRHGTYRIGFHAFVTTPADTFSADTLRDVMCSDAFCETFETGSIRSGAPFHWVTGADSAWTVLPSIHHTGGDAAVTPPSTTKLAYTLSTTMTLGAPGTIQFAYLVAPFVSGSALRFIVDGVVQGSLTTTPTWGLATFTIPAGTHTLTWNLHKTAVSAAEIAALDDIAFPPSAQLAGVESGAAPPLVSALAPCRPNPVRTTAVIPFTLPRAAHVRLSVFDLLGREVVRLADADYAAGAHERTLDASRLSPGLYTIRIVAGDLRATRTMVRIR